jgi:putative intracellular protease/amidase
MASPQIVHLLLLEGSSDWEPGYAVAGINQQMFQAQPGRYAVRTVGVSREPIRTIGGVRILPDLALEEVDPRASAMLIMVGATAWDESEQPLPVTKAAEYLAQGTPVAAICGATLGLAKGGMLNDRPHTSNAREYLQGAAGYRGGGQYVDAPAVRDGDLITASGIAPIDFARCIFERLELYTPPVLQAWYDLYSKHDAAAFYSLMQESQQGETG